MQSYGIDFSEFVSYKHTPLCPKAHTWYCVRLWFIQFQLCTYSPSCNCTQIYLSIVLMDICIIPSICLCIVYIPIHSFMLARSILLCVSSAHVQDFLGVELQPCMHAYFVSPGNAKLFSKMVIQIYTLITTDGSSFGSTSS